MPWSRDNFTNGEKYWRARQVMGMFMDAIANGTVDQITPLGDPLVSDEHVSKAVATIDREWAIEWEGRGKSQNATSCPEFSTRLPAPQQRALVEMIRVCLGKSPGSLEAAEPWFWDYKR